MPLPAQNIRGVKRKRPHDKESEEDKEAKLRRKLSILKHHAVRELRKIVKKTRAFEVQKILKKLKEARRKDPESDVTKDLGAQMEILKHVSCDRLARSALTTKLKKDKTLSVDPTVQAVSVELASNSVSLVAPGTPTAKVQSRILSSKVLAPEVVSIVESLRTLLHPPAGSEGIGDATDNFHVLPNISKRRRTGPARDKAAFSSGDDAVNASGEGSDEVFEGANGDEAVTEVDDNLESGIVGAPSRSDDSVAGAANDDSGPEDSSCSADLPSKDPKSKKTQPHGSKCQSEFLPSLSVGFTPGDSGSEFSDTETKLVDGIKKNRRGQRARRAMWEKKFGKNANHVKKQQQHATERRLPGFVPADRQSGKGNSSSRPCRTPIQSRDHEQVGKQALGRGPEGTRPSGSAKGQSEGNVNVDLRRNRPQGDRPLHPSWEAKRKQKSAGIVRSQGTKIVFSES